MAYQQLLAREQEMDRMRLHQQQQQQLYDERQRLLQQKYQHPHQHQQSQWQQQICDENDGYAQHAQRQNESYYGNDPLQQPQRGLFEAQEMENGDSFFDAQNSPDSPSCFDALD